MLDFEHPLEQGSRWNHHVNVPHFHVKCYVRRTTRFLNRRIYDTLELASVEIPERYQGRGLFAAFMKEFEKTASVHGLVVYVESILNFQLYQQLLKHGYVEVKGSHPSCLYKAPTGVIV